MENTLTQMTVSPSEYFDSPKEVLAAKNLSINDKKKILKSWKSQCISMSVSKSEGMSPVTGPDGTALSEVVTALDQLKA